MGRQLTIDAELLTKICAMVTAGCSLRRAAILCDFNEQTLRSFARRDQAFRERLKAAELARELYPLRAIRDASSTNWRAAAWLLKNVAPNAWGDRRMDTIPVTEHGETLKNCVDLFGKMVSESLKRPSERKTFRKKLKAFQVRIKQHEEICSDPLLTPVQRRRHANGLNGPAKTDSGNPRNSNS